MIVINGTEKKKGKTRNTWEMYHRFAQELKMPLIFNNQCTNNNINRTQGRENTFIDY